MKKSIKIVSIIFIACSLLINISLAASGSFSVSKSSVNLTVGEKSNINVTATNCAGKFTITSSNPSVVKVSESSIWLDNNSQSFSISAGTAGTATVTIKTSDVASSDESELNDSKSITVTVKEKQTESKPKENKPKEEKPKEPTFKSTNQTVYTTGNINLRSSWSTSSSAVSVPKGTELNLVGTSNETVNGYVWYKVKYKGNTKYVSKNLVTTEKPEEKKDETDKSNKNLAELSIEGVEISPAFDKEITQYSAELKENLTEVTINAKPENESSKVSIEGNKELKDGDNIVKIIVTASDNTSRTYFITLKKNVEETNSSSLQLKELKIKGVDFNSSFSPDVYTYKLKLNVFVDKLEITGVPNQENAKIEIIGNEELKEGNNTITILLTSEDGKETVTYQIDVEEPSKTVVAKNNNNKILLICAIAVVISVIIIVVSIVVYKKKNNEMDDFEENEEDDEENEDSKFNTNSFLSYDKQENKNPIDDNSDGNNKKPKGKHSV